VEDARQLAWVKAQQKPAAYLDLRLLLSLDGDVGFSGWNPLPECLQILRAGAKADVFPEQRASGVGAGSAMDGAAGNINADPDGHKHLLVLGGCVVVVTAAGAGTSHSL
jgi:hypothetical protein